MASLQALQAVDLVQRTAQGLGVEGLEVPLNGVLVVDEYPIDECFHLCTGTVVSAIAKQTSSSSRPRRCATPVSGHMASADVCSVLEDFLD